MNVCRVHATPEHDTSISGAHTLWQVGGNQQSTPYSTPASAIRQVPVQNWSHIIQPVVCFGRDANQAVAVAASAASVRQTSATTEMARRILTLEEASVVQFRGSIDPADCLLNTPLRSIHITSPL